MSGLKKDSTGIQKLTAAKNEASDNLLQFFCDHCHQTVDQEISSCPNCNRKHLVNASWPPPISSEYQPTAATDTASSPKKILSLLSGIGVGVWLYIILLFSAWAGGNELSRRYMPPYPGSIGIVMWIMLLMFPLLPIRLFTIRCSSIEQKVRIGITLGAVLGFLLAMVLLLLFLIDAGWKHDAGY